MLSPSLIQQQRIALVANGYARVVVETNGKKPIEASWPDKSRNVTLQEVSSQWPDAGSLNTGVLADDLCAIDIDVDDNRELVSKVIELARQLLGNAPIRYRDNSTRVLTLYRVSDWDKKQRLSAVEGSLGNVDFLTNNKQFVAYGTHPSGEEYKWDFDLKTIPRATLPAVTFRDVSHFREQLIALLGAKSSHVAPATTTFVSCDAPQGFAPIAERAPATRHESEYAQAALRNEVEKLLAMRAGSHRNNALNVSAHSLGTMVSSGWIDAVTVASALYEAAERNGYVTKRGEEAAKKTIASGIEAGMSKPRDPLPVDAPGTLIDPSRLVVSDKPASKALAADATKNAVVLTRLADIGPMVTDWHWTGYIPAGMLTLLAGAGGTGKSTLAFSFAATVTTAGCWPDGTRCATPGNVLVWSSEDDLSRTIVPRLIAAGADLTRIASVEGTIDERGLNLPFDPALHMDDLRQQVRQVPGGVSLLIVDPIVSAVSGDMHRANDVRRSLQPIVDFAAEQGCAVLGITHFAKNTGGNNTTERVIGSQAFAALARMVLATAKEEESEQRVFTRAKSNISLDGGGFHYTIQELGVRDHSGRNINTTRVVWGDAMQGNARSILSSVEGQNDEFKPINRVEEAMQFLRTEIARGPVPARDLIERAKRDFGINERSLQRAREKMGIVATKAGYQGAWVWSYQV
ncbi:MAG: AAA family ATPase [Edaphobacter sp.]